MKLTKQEINQIMIREFNIKLVELLSIEQISNNEFKLEIQFKSMLGGTLLNGSAIFNIDDQTIRELNSN